MRILQATAEYYPYSKTGGLADMVAGLSGALVASSEEVTVVTPLYRGVREQAPEIKAYGSEFKIPLGDNTFVGRWWKIQAESGVTVLFLENDEFYNRPGLYMSGPDGYWDNPERFMFLSKAVVRIASEYDVVHVHDWQTAFVPMLLKFAEAKNTSGTVLTVHNLAYQGQCEGNRFGITNLPSKYFDREGPELWGSMNFLKAGLHYADHITTVSPKYAQEILTAEFGEGLEGVLQSRLGNLAGILNGVDYREWNTINNPHLPAAYNTHDFTGKFECKRALQTELGLPPKDAPLFGSISRLAYQKGIDVMIDALEKLLCENSLQVVVLGSGEKGLSDRLVGLCRKHTDSIRFVEGYNDRLAHLIEAGSDFFLMPSRFEPCGLNQLYSLRYGTLPIVHGVGGLDDTVEDMENEGGNGYKFYGLSAHNLCQAIRRSLLLYDEKNRLNSIKSAAMQLDYSWANAVKAYQNIYSNCSQ